MIDSSRRPIVYSDGSGSSNVDVATRMDLVRELRRWSDDCLFLPPLEWAVLAGFEPMLVSTVPPPSTWDGTTLPYTWCSDRRLLGEQHFDGLSRLTLIRNRVLHTDDDVHALALDLAVPVEVRRMSIPRIADAQPDYPIELIIEALRGWR